MDRDNRLIRVLIVDDSIFDFVVLVRKCQSMFGNDVELHWLGNLYDAKKLVSSKAIEFDLKFLDMIGTSLDPNDVLNVSEDEFILNSHMVTPTGRASFIRKQDVINYIENFVKLKRNSPPQLD